MGMAPHIPPLSTSVAGKARHATVHMISPQISAHSACIAQYTLCPRVVPSTERECLCGPIHSVCFSAQPACLGNAVDLSTLVVSGGWGGGLALKGYEIDIYGRFSRRAENPSTLTASRFSDETRFAESNSPTNPRSNLSARLRAK